MITEEMGSCIGVDMHRHKQYGVFLRQFVFYSLERPQEHPHQPLQAGTRVVSYSSSFQWGEC